MVPKLASTLLESRSLLHAHAAIRHLDAARDRALDGDLDGAVDALHDLKALHAELRAEPEDRA